MNPNSPSHLSKFDRLISRSWFSPLILCLIGLLLLTPFIAKSFQVDDPVYVWVARQIVHHPLDFYGFNLNWEGNDQPVSQFCENPPLVPYILAMASFITGWSEAGLHAAMLPFNLLSIAGMYFLAARFCRRPALATGLLLIAPAFLVSATTIMCEPVMLCCWIWAIVLWIRGSEKYCASTLLLAGLMAAAALLAKFIAIALIPLLILYALLWKSSMRIRLYQIVSLLIPIAVIIGYQAYSSHLYGNGLLTHAVQYAARANGFTHIPFVLRLSDTMAFTGGGTASACIAALFLIRRRFAIAGMVIAIILAFIAAILLQPPIGWRANQGGVMSQTPEFTWPAFCFFFQYGLMMVGFAAVVGICIHAVVVAGRHKDLRAVLFLGVWILGIFCFAAFLNWSINARAVLPLVPALCILMVRGFDQIEALPPLRLRTAMTIACVLGGAVTTADYRFAATCRLAVQPLLAVACQVDPPTRIWFGGHWGFQYYMQAKGIQPLDVISPKCQVGDVLILPASGYGGPIAMQGLRLIREVNVGADHWLGTIQLPMGAGFYISFGYHLPFVFGPIPPEKFAVVQVTPTTHLGHPPNGK